MFKYFLKKRLREKQFVFWSMIFPLALMTFMHIAFGNIYDIENHIDPMKTCVVTEDTGVFVYNFQSLMDEMSDENGDNYYFDLDYAASVEPAKKSLEDGEYEILFEVKADDIKVFLAPGHSATSAYMAKAVCDSYMRNYDLIMEAYEKDPGSAQAVLDNTLEEVSYTKPAQSAFSEDPDPYSWFFYSTLVMGIFFNSMSGVAIVSELCADVSADAMRLSVSSAKKSRMIISSFLSKFSISFVIVLIQLLFMRYVMDISLGNSIPKLLLFVASSILFSLGFGVICGTIFKGSTDNRGNKTTSVVMISVFLSGEMIQQLPGVFEKYAPFINDINPATVMNMAFYKLAICGDYTGFYMDIAKILVTTLIFIAIGVFVLRREKYASL